MDDLHVLEVVARVCSLPGTSWSQRPGVRTGNNRVDRMYSNNMFGLILSE